MSDKIKFTGVEIPEINKKAKRNVILWLNDEYFYRVLNTKADKDSTATQGNIAIFDSEGNPVDSGVNIAGTPSFKGIVNTGTDISGLTNYSAGWYWVVGTAGTYVGQNCEAGDTIYCKSDFDSAYSADDFYVVQTNIDMSVIPHILYVTNITQLTDAQCNSLKVGDIVVDGQTFCYTVEAKSDVLILLVSLGLGIWDITLVSYFRGSNWEYNDTRTINLQNKADKTVYVGDGSSYQNDLETFNLYAADSGWATHCGSGVPGAGRVDLWWNYNGEYRTYLVQENLTNFTNSNPVEWPYITRNESYNTTIVSNNDTSLSRIRVKMYEAVDDGVTPDNSTDITSQVYNASTGEINIPYVTGNVIIEEIL